VAGGGRVARVRRSWLVEAEKHGCRETGEGDADVRVGEAAAGRLQRRHARAREERLEQTPRRRRIERQFRRAALPPLPHALPYRGGRLHSRSVKPATPSRTGLVAAGSAIIGAWSISVRSSPASSPPPPPRRPPRPPPPPLCT